MKKAFLLFLLIFSLPIVAMAGSFGLWIEDASTVVLPARPVGTTAFNAMTAITNDQILTQGQLCKVGVRLYMALEAGACTNVPTFGTDSAVSGGITFYNMKGRKGKRNGYAICNTTSGDLNVGMGPSIAAMEGITVVEDGNVASDAYGVYSGTISAIAQSGTSNYVTIAEW